MRCTGPMSSITPLCPRRSKHNRLRTRASDTSFLSRDFEEMDQLSFGRGGIERHVMTVLYIHSVSSLFNLLDISIRSLWPRDYASLDFG